jgi:hypothetical protein
VNDWNIRGQDIDQQYATYCTRAFDDRRIWNLSMASTVLESQIACALYLTHVSTTTAFAEKIREWAHCAALAENRPKRRRNGKRATPLARIPDAAVKQAGFDGVLLALFGAIDVVPLRERARQFQVDREAYARVRDAVGTDAVNRIANFRHALAYMHGYVRDRDYDEKLETANVTAGDSFLMREEQENKKGLALGCYLTSARDPDVISTEQETLADDATSHRGFYDERYEARMRAESYEDKTANGNQPAVNDPRGGDRA